MTGANTGLGLETAAELAGAGATVVLACRDQAKGAGARDQIRRRTPAAEVEVLVLDLGELSAVEAAARELCGRFPSIDLLINNAGVMVPPKSTTADGFELQFGTNHLGHFAFTASVLPAMLEVEGSRIVTVSSIAHREGRMRWDDPQWERSYSRAGAYGQSKLANLLFTFELDRRLRAADAETMALAAHPGVSATELGRHIPLANLPGIKQVIGAATSFVSQSAADGALPTLRAATDPDACGSAYYGPAHRREMKGPPVLVMPMPHALDEDDQTRLWTISEELTGVTFPI